MYNPLDLSGKKILITGASSGIGRACAIEASRLGASVVVLARKEDRLQETLSMMEGAGHSFIKFDLAEIGGLESVFVQACEDGKSLDGLVHAAGIGDAAPLIAIDLAMLDRVMTVNYFAFVILAKYFSKKKYAGKGSIVGVSSVSGVVGWQGVSVYSGSKGAMDSSARSMAIELASKGIRVNTVVPSNIRTPMYDAIIQMNDDEAVGKILAKQPLGLGESEDVAHAVAFLLSDASRFITGTQMVVDGGYLAQ